MLNNSWLYGYILAPSSRYTFKNEVDGEFIYGPGLSLFKTYHMCISRFLFFVMQELLVQHSTILILWTDTQLTASYYRPVLAWPPVP